MNKLLTIILVAIVLFLFARSAVASTNEGHSGTQGGHWLTCSINRGV